MSPVKLANLQEYKYSHPMTSHATDINYGDQLGNESLPELLETGVLFLL